MAYGRHFDVFNRRDYTSSHLPNSSSYQECKRLFRAEVDKAEVELVVEVKVVAERVVRAMAEVELVVEARVEVELVVEARVEADMVEVEEEMVVEKMVEVMAEVELVVEVMVEADVVEVKLVVEEMVEEVMVEVRGADPQTLQEGIHFPRDQKRSAQAFLITLHRLYGFMHFQHFSQALSALLALSALSARLKAGQETSALPSSGSAGSLRVSQERARCFSLSFFHEASQKPVHPVHRTRAENILL